MPNTPNSLRIDKRVPLTWLVGMVVSLVLGLVGGTVAAMSLYNTADSNKQDIGSIQGWIAKRPAELPTRATEKRLARIEFNQIAILRALDAIQRKLNGQ